MENNECKCCDGCKCGCKGSCCCSVAALMTSGIVFTLFGLAHLYRLLAPFPIVFGAYVVPEWVSGVAVVLSALLAIWNFCSACKLKKCDCKDCKCDCHKDHVDSKHDSV